MAQVLEARGHRVVGTDLVDRGYGEAGRDFLAETHLPEGVTAIVTNPPYGRTLYKFADRALELTRPVGGGGDAGQYPVVDRGGEQHTATSPGIRGVGGVDKPDRLVSR
jgi:hypothetical protein